MQGVIRRDQKKERVLSEGTRKKFDVWIMLEYLSGK